MRDADVVGRLQELSHGAGHDYVIGSPHLRHPDLHAWVSDRVGTAVSGAAPAGRRLRVLEVGAGHGTFTAQLVAAGAEVVVTEMSEPSADELRARFAATPQVEVIHDPAGELAVEGPFDAVVYLSVLHHIPDYVAAVSAAVEHLVPGGTFVSFQDPLWYSRQSRFARAASRAVYLAWRLGRGDLLRGLAATVRRARDAYDADDPSDMVEYHVVREGVDELALLELLRSRFRSTDLMPYWSTQSAWGQRLGRRFLPANTFGLVASGFTTTEPTP